jgi:hypothetical protein
MKEFMAVVGYYLTLAIKGVQLLFSICYYGLWYSKLYMYCIYQTYDAFSSDPLIDLENYELFKFQYNGVEYKKDDGTFREDTIMLFLRYLSLYNL